MENVSYKQNLVPKNPTGRALVYKQSNAAFTLNVGTTYHIFPNN